VAEARKALRSNGGLCEILGRNTDAIRHYHAYKKLAEG
jgi:hypothetical protein